MLSRDANALIIARHGASDKDRDLSRNGATSGGGLPRSTRVRAPESGSVNHDPVSHAPLLPPGSVSVALPSYRRRYFASGSFSRVSPGFPLIHQGGRCRLEKHRRASAVRRRSRISIPRIANRRISFLPRPPASFIRPLASRAGETPARSLTSSRRLMRAWNPSSR